MPEQLNKILEKVLEWWKKFNTKQRTLLISITAVIVLALVILGVVISKPNYVELVTCADSAEASKITGILNENGTIKYTIDDRYRIQVEAKDRVDALMLLADNDIPATPTSMDDVVGGGLSVTEADKEKKYKLYLEEQIANDLESLDFVDFATTRLTLPDNDGTILSQDEEAKIGITLGLKRTIDDEQAYAVARLVASELGNETTDRVTIIDQKGNVLFSGSDQNSSTGITASKLKDRDKLQNMMRDSITTILKDSGIFSDISVSANIDMNYDESTIAKKEYTVPEGQEEGIVYEEHRYESSAENSDAALPPGTDTNGDNTDYMTTDSDNSSSSVTDNDLFRDVNETITTIESKGGKIDYDTSSVSVVATRYIVYDQKMMEENGELQDTTWEKFKADHSEPIKVEEVDADLIKMVQTTTGFQNDNITFLIYEQPDFIDKTTRKISVTDILQIVLAVLIFALLGFVVFRSLKSEKEPEPEPELSVETLLEATGEAQESLEDIGYAEKSETRLLIEKFVDENPDAVALLLRNWLNEDWE